MAREKCIRRTLFRTQPDTAIGRPYLSDQNNTMSLGLGLNECRIETGTCFFPQILSVVFEFTPAYWSNLHRLASLMEQNITQPKILAAVISQAPLSLIRLGFSACPSSFTPPPLPGLFPIDNSFTCALDTYSLSCMSTRRRKTKNKNTEAPVILAFLSLQNKSCLYSQEIPMSRVRLSVSQKGCIKPSATVAKYPISTTNKVRTVYCTGLASHKDITHELILPRISLLGIGMHKSATRRISRTRNRNSINQMNSIFFLNVRLIYMRTRRSMVR